MTELTLYRALLVSYVALAVVTFPLLLASAAPYGRYAKKRGQPEAGQSHPRGPCPAIIAPVSL